MTEKISDNMTMEALNGCLAALPDELDWTEIGALFDTILDTYEVNDFDGMKIGCGLAHNRANPTEARDYDAGSVSDDQRARAALSLLPKQANGNQVINLVCMILESYSISPRHADLALGEAARRYKAHAEGRDGIMSAIARVLGSIGDGQEITAEMLQEQLSGVDGVGNVRVVELTEDDDPEAQLDLLRAEPKGHA